jgi:hypothetical protein
LASLFIPIYKLLKNKKLKWSDILISISFILTIYTSLILTNLETKEYEDYQSRFNLASFEWRVHYWKNFIEFNEPFIFLFGHGTGSAEIKGLDLESRSPHNDYLRIFYDLGVIGLCIYLALICFIFNLLMTSCNRYGALIYLIIVSFSLSDNLIFFSYSIWLFIFLASISIKNEGTIHLAFKYRAF